MRAKVPHAQGLWPAFWLRHRSGAGVAEVDIMEYFHSQVPGRDPDAPPRRREQRVEEDHDLRDPAATPGFHTWAVEILPDPGGVRFSFFVDNIKVHTYIDAKHAWTSADAAGTWDIALNLAVGGRWVGSPDGTLGLLELLEPLLDLRHRPRRLLHHRHPPGRLGLTPPRPRSPSTTSGSTHRPEG